MTSNLQYKKKLTMSKRSLLKRINQAITPDGTQVDFSTFDQSVETLKKSLKEKVQVQTLDDVNAQLAKFQKKIDLSPLTEAVKGIQEQFTSKHEELSQQLDDKLSELETVLSTKTSADDSKSGIDALNVQIDDLKTQLSGLEVTRKNDLTALGEQIVSSRDINSRIERATAEIGNELAVIRDTASASKETNNATAKELENSLEKLRRDLMSRIANIGGGSMNRQMFIGGVDPLTKYTDMNLKAGSNVTITYVNNNTTKKVDVTFSSSGGGGGSVRSINSISTNTVAGSASGTDYVYLCSGTITLTLPDAVANTNLYTVKNVGTGVVTIATTSAQTIDASPTVVMPVQYTAVDLISDTANWNVT